MIRMIAGDGWYVIENWVTCTYIYEWWIAQKEYGRLDNRRIGWFLLCFGKEVELIPTTTFTFPPTKEKNILKNRKLSFVSCLSSCFAFFSLEGPLYGSQRGIGWLTQNWHDMTPSLGWHDTIAFLTIPVILVITQSFSQKLLSPPVDMSDPKAAQTAQILKYLPLMIGWFSLNVPSGLGIYWITNNLVSTAISLRCVAGKACMDACRLFGMDVFAWIDRAR